MALISPRCRIPGQGLYLIFAIASQGNPLRGVRPASVAMPHDIVVIAIIVGACLLALAIASSAGCDASSSGVFR